MRNEMVKKLEQEINNVKEAVVMLADELECEMSYDINTNGTYTISTLINGVVYSVTEALAFAKSTQKVLTLFSNEMLEGRASARVITDNEKILREYITRHEIENMWVTLEGEVMINSEVYCNVDDFEGIFESLYTEYDVIMFDTFLVKAKSNIFDEWLEIVEFEVE